MLREASSELTCGCCFGLLVEPTALACGHTFCRHCLATWTVTSGKRLCPTCREEWRGSPRVNIILRNMLQETWSQTLADRMQEVNTDENLQFISAFDNMTTVETHPDIDRGSQVGTPRDPHEAFVNRTRLKFLASGAAVASLVFCFLWKFDDIRSQSTLIETQIKQWDTDDVVEWMGQLGPWADRYHEDIKTNNIDGNMLLMMQGSDALDLLHMANEEHRRLFLREISVMLASGTKQPANLWEYKSRFPFFTLGMLYGLKFSPRITIGYIYLFHYEKVYTPFMAHSSLVFSGTEKKEADSFTRMIYILFMPYYFVGRYALEWETVHYWVSRYIALWSFLACIHDMIWVIIFFKRTLTEEDIKDSLVRYFYVALECIIILCLPWVLFNCCFFYQLLVTITVYPKLINTACEILRRQT